MRAARSLKSFLTSVRPGILRRATAALAVALALSGATACGDDDDPNSPGGVAGTYQIVRVNNDQTAPFLVFEQTAGSFTFRTEITSGTMTLRGDGTYTAVLQMRFQTTGEPDETETDEETGRFSVSGNSITFDPTASGEPNYTATRSGNDITFSYTDFDGNTVTITARK